MAAVLAAAAPAAAAARAFLESTGASTSAPIPAAGGAGRVEVRIRWATAADLVLALWDGDSQVALGQLVDLDRDTRTVIGALLAELGVADHSHIDRWLASTDAVLEDRNPL